MSIPVQLNCKGHPCSTCDKCRDWYFTGDLATWNWICNWANWGDCDWERYRNDRMHERFKHRDNGACTDIILHFFRYGGFSHLRHDFGVWLCEDNKEQ